MTNTPSISVVIPAYNAAATVGDAIRSVLDQSLQPNEIIVIDDGSSDDTARQVQAFSTMVRLVHQPNAGPAAARNRGIAEANSDWVAFLDADDCWYPEKLARQAMLILRSPDVDIVFCDWYEKDRCGTVTDRGSTSPASRMNPKDCRPVEIGEGGSVLTGDVFSALLSTYFLHTNTLLIRSSLLQQNGFDTAFRWGEDWLLALDLAYHGATFGYVDEVLTEYRNRENSICTNANFRTVADRYASSTAPLMRYGPLTLKQRIRLYPRIRMAGRNLGIRFHDEKRDSASARSIWRETAMWQPIVPHLPTLVQSILPPGTLDVARSTKAFLIRTFFDNKVTTTKSFELQSKLK
ncbi:putative glycosyltransferase EpsJ [Novipirellula aureliae]|uniref:Putative glycosyltransferase EpsJ n=1 Tax=Novipirellula aureliae TaxID=2527966 RepID=A0A5C6DX32_9BACT|nr:glycosyltransferase family 2 protein [Novipirellula aureliae]TWU41300.1 putative glycosyltransferase EpsJ [Novipirellula aureliae]